MSQENAERQVVAVLGTGLLGAGMALRLIDQGHTVRVWNRTRARAEVLAVHGAQVADSPAEAVSGVSRIHILLAEDDAVESVFDACADEIGMGVPTFDHATNLPARVAARYSTLREKGIQYFNAPVFMGPSNTRDGSGLMLIAGPEAEVEAQRPRLLELTGKLWHVGERPDLAAVHKLSGNALLIALSGAMGDILQMGAAQGLGAAEVLSLFDVFKPGAALPAFGNRVARAGTAPASFELTMARKDLRLMVESAGGPEHLIVLPALGNAMDTAIAAGHGAQDFAIFARPRA